MRGEIDEAEKKREELKTLLRRRRGMEALEVEAQRKESERARREVTLAGFMCAAAPTSKRRPALIDARGGHTAASAGLIMRSSMSRSTLLGCAAALAAATSAESS
jgi:hypothetical protein